MTYFWSAIFAFFGTMGFTILFNCPKKSVFKASLIGALGWTGYMLTVDSGQSVITATFVGAITVGLIGELFANKFRSPATIFIIPGIIPLVPGYGIYYTMISIITKDYNTATTKGFEALFVALAIATALIITSTVGRLIRNNKTSHIMYYTKS
jgi:uncharacterized membrane protein YjjB (DUF3815 family)